ncbi:hypothetical protein AB0K09_33745 [Streptomyces sp. NPDC049577]|uniref:hypothetical protein n=1 Tax=Streptomyces sp. NPDC049577 TaxID=3155153 RepID=UPI003449E4DE
MTTGALIIVLVVAAAVVAAVALAVPALRRRAATGGRGLRRRFGPEYEAAVARHDGDMRAAEKDLGERLRRHKDVRTLPLPAGVREQYAVRWAGIQERFVDEPTGAVADADRLLGELARQRGFPADSWDDLVESLSVHHPHTVHGLREIHLAAARARAGQAPTEELREALVRARGLFEDLVTARPEDRPPQRHARRDGPRPARTTARTGIRKEGV